MMRNPSRRPRCVAIAVALAVPLVSCAPIEDDSAARLCRTVIPAIEPAGSMIDVVGVEQLSSQTGVRINFASRRPRQEPAIHWVECRFQGPVRDASTLDSVRTEVDSLTPARLYVLKRFWLSTPEAAAADPLSVAGAERVASIPFIVAYGLQQAVNALPGALLYALLAASYALVYGLVGRINLAFGELAAIGATAALYGVMLAGQQGGAIGLAAAAILAVVSASFYGAVAGRLVFQPLAKSGTQTALVATVGLAVFLREYVRLVQGPAWRWAAPGLSRPLALVRAGRFVTTTTPVALAMAALTAVVGVGLLAVLRWSRFGQTWRACADDPGAAALMGVDARQVFSTTFVLASAIAGLAGFATTAMFGGLGYEGAASLGLKALVGAVLGGVGSVPGAFLGGLAIGAFEGLWSSLFSGINRDLAVYGVLAATLIWRPQGFWGAGSATPSPRR